MVMSAAQRPTRHRGHSNNIHGAGYDIERLAARHAELAPFVRTIEGQSPNIDFGDPRAVAALNTALLVVDYGVDRYTMPQHHLMPPVPGRADYIHVVADLLAADNGGVAPSGARVRGLDIGCGASCIYPLLGHAIHGWSFVGTDVSKSSLRVAHKLMQGAGAPVLLRHQPEASQVLRGGIMRPDDGISFTVCNPPFFRSAKVPVASPVLVIDIAAVAAPLTDSVAP